MIDSVPVKTNNHKNTKKTKKGQFHEISGRFKKILKTKEDFMRLKIFRGMGVYMKPFETHQVSHEILKPFIYYPKHIHY